jgi:hypothetical protein
MWRAVAKGRLDEPGEGRLDADGRGLFALKSHGSHQSDRQRQLDVAIAAFITIDEILQEKRDVAQLLIATLAQFGGDLGGDIL